MSQHCIGRNLVYSNAKNYQSLLVTVLHSNLKDDSLCQYCTWYTFMVIEELSLIIVIIVQVSAIGLFNYVLLRPLLTSVRNLIMFNPFSNDSVAIHRSFAHKLEIIKISFFFFVLIIFMHYASFV